MEIANIGNRKITIGTIAVASLVIFLALMLISGTRLKPQLDNPTLVTTEESLFKMKTLQLKPGQAYTYEYSAMNESVNLTYGVFKGNNCTLIVLSGSETSICLDQAGNDALGLNSSFEVPAFILFKPWMLAVDQGWIWNIATLMSIDLMQKPVAKMQYSFIRKEYYNGREALVVRINSSDGDEAIDWIDSEKRILLKEVGNGYEARLVSGLEFD